MNYNYYTPGAGGGAGPFLGIGGLIGLLIGLVVLVFMLYVYARIFHKAGYSGWLAVLMLIPLVNLVVIIWFAFAHWPVERGAAGPPPAYPQQPSYQPPPPPPAGYPGGQPTPQH